MRRVIGILVLLILAAAVFVGGYRAYAGMSDPLAGEAEMLVRAYLSQELIERPEEYADRVTENLLQDIQRIRQARESWEKERGVRITMSFVRFVRRPVLVVVFPPEGDPTWKRYTAVAVYQTAVGTFMGQVDVDFVRVDGEWKADRIRGAIPLAELRDGRWERMEAR